MTTNRPKITEIESEKVNFLNVNGMANVCTSVLPAFLDMKDLTTLSLVCKRAHSLFHQPIKNSGIIKFLQHLLFRQLDKAQFMLRANPELFFARGNVEDYSRRRFNMISAFEYLVWAGDQLGWNMVLTLIPRDNEGLNIIDELLRQLDSVDISGLCYQLDGKTVQETKYDNAPHLAAIKNYLDNYTARDFEQRKTYWVKTVGALQQLVPVCIANKICRKDAAITLAIDPQTDDSETSVWFPLDNSDLGKKFAIARGDNRGVGCLAPSQHMAGETLKIINKANKDSDRLRQTLRQQLLQAIREREPSITVTPQKTKCVIC